MARWTGIERRLPCQVTAFGFIKASGEKGVLPVGVNFAAKQDPGVTPFTPLDTTASNSASNNDQTVPPPPCNPLGWCQSIAAPFAATIPARVMSSGYQESQICYFKLHGLAATFQHGKPLHNVEVSRVRSLLEVIFSGGFMALQS